MNREFVLLPYYYCTESTQGDKSNLNGSSRTKSHDCSVAACGGVLTLPQNKHHKADTAYVWYWLGTCNWGHVLKHVEYLRERNKELQLSSTGRVDCTKELTVLLDNNFHSRLIEKMKPLGATSLL